MKILRTPDSAFANLVDYSFTPHYTEVDQDGQRLRLSEKHQCLWPLRSRPQRVRKELNGTARDLTQRVRHAGHAKSE